MSNLQNRVVQALIPALEYRVDAMWQSAQFQKMGSEIERAFAATLVVGTWGDVRIVDSIPEEDFLGIFLVPQYPVGRYRLDFLLGAGMRRAPTKCVAIECDGHAFHEKTKEQAAHDKARDRQISAELMGILRFAGSEIYRDVSACAVEAIEFLGKARNL